MDPRDILRGFFFGFPKRCDLQSRKNMYLTSFSFSPRPNEVDPGEERSEEPPGHGRPNRRDNLHFEVMINPLEMERFFDQQLDGILRSFGSFGFGPGGGAFGSPPPPSFGGGGPLHPTPPPPDEGGLGRGPAWGFPFEGWGMLTPPSSGGRMQEDDEEGASAGSRDFMLRGGYEPESGRKEDVDLDSLPRESVGQLLDELKEPEVGAGRVMPEFPSPFGGFFGGGNPAREVREK